MELFEILEYQDSNSNIYKKRKSHVYQNFEKVSEKLGLSIFWCKEQNQQTFKDFFGSSWKISIKNLIDWTEQVFKEK